MRYYIETSAYCPVLTVYFTKLVKELYQAVKVWLGEKIYIFSPVLPR